MERLAFSRDFRMGSKHDPAFFVMLPDRGSSYDTEYLPVDPVYLGNAPQCPRCKKYIGQRPWRAPHRAEVSWHGAAVGDFAFFSSADFLVSQRARDIFDTAGLTGFGGFSKVDIVRVRPPSDKQFIYYYTDVVRSRAARDLRSFNPQGADLIPCPECLDSELDEINGVLLKPGSWSGEDVFVARGLPGLLLVTDVFREVVERGELTNVRFVQSAEYRWSATEGDFHE